MGCAQSSYGDYRLAGKDERRRWSGPQHRVPRMKRPLGQFELPEKSKPAESVELPLTAAADKESVVKDNGAAACKHTQKDPVEVALAVGAEQGCGYFDRVALKNGSNGPECLAHYIHEAGSNLSWPDATFRLKLVKAATSWLKLFLSIAITEWWDPSKVKGSLQDVMLLHYVGMMLEQDKHSIQQLSLTPEEVSLIQEARCLPISAAYNQCGSLLERIHSSDYFCNKFAMDSNPLVKLIDEHREF